MVPKFPENQIEKRFLEAINWPLLGNTSSSLIESSKLANREAKKSHKVAFSGRFEFELEFCKIFHKFEHAKRSIVGNSKRCVRLRVLVDA